MKTRIVIRTTIVVPLIFLASALVLLSFSFLGDRQQTPRKVVVRANSHP